MLVLLECVTVQHDEVTVLLAASISFIGMLAFFHLLLRAEESAASRYRNWIAIAAFASGLSVWATHFLAMLAYRGPTPIGFDVTFTVLSALIAVAGFWVMLTLPGHTPGQVASRALVATATVGAMHFVGMAGLDVAATVEYRFAPILWGAMAAYASFFLAFWLFPRLAGFRRIVLPALGGVLGICALHFTAMSAAILVPDPLLAGPGTDETDRLWLTVAISGATLLLLAIMAVAAFIDRHLVDLSGFANATLDGLAMVRQGQIIETNARFAALLDMTEKALIGRRADTLLVAADGLAADAPRVLQVEASPRAGDTTRIFELAVHTVEYRGKPTEVLAVRDLTEKRAAQRKVEYLARHDVLTGLANRTLFLERLDRQLSLCGDAGEPFALLALDLDRFKVVNDVFGHAEGDRVLKDVSVLLTRCVGAGDTVARLGGDEFMIVMSRPSHVDAARQLAENILARFRQDMDCAVDPTAVGVSIGIAVFPQDGAEKEALIRAADLALYRAKVNGRRTLAFYDRTMDQETRERRQMEAELRQAVHRGELRLSYQPIQSVGGGEISGYEALVRWRHPVRGEVPASAFMPIAEETGIVIVLGEWVLEQACREACGWEPHLKVAVNVSPVQFRLANLAFVVSRILAETGLRPERLELEITESALLKDREATLATLRQIKALGVSIVMDDFGTGYSSLSNLQSFPFDKIKIDRSFIAAMKEDESARAIVRAVVGLGRSLSMPVTAEGIETDEQYRMAADEGCAEVQGYLVGRPAITLPKGPPCEAMECVG